MTAEDARAALTGSLGGDPGIDPGAVLEDGPAPLCNAPCKGLYGAGTLCERPRGHQPPCAPAVMTAAAERESQRRLDHSYASAGMTANGTRPQTSVTDRVTALAEWWASNPSAVRIALNEEGFPRPTANVSHEIELISRLAVHLREALELEAGDPGPAEGTREQAEALIKRACTILEKLGGDGPADLEAMHLDPDHLTVLAALRDSLRPFADEPVEPPRPPGQFGTIAFFGHLEHTGYITEITMHGGQPGYRIDLPELIWGGNQSAYREYAASAMFSRWPVDETSVLAAWKADRERADQRRQQEAARAAARAEALPAGPPTGLCTCTVTDDGTAYEVDPQCPVHGSGPAPF